MTVLVSKDMEAARYDSSGVSRYGAVGITVLVSQDMGTVGIADKGQRDFVLKLLQANSA